MCRRKCDNCIYWLSYEDINEDPLEDWDYGVCHLPQQYGKCTCITDRCKNHTYTPQGIVLLKIKKETAAQ